MNTVEKVIINSILSKSIISSSLRDKILRKCFKMKINKSDIRGKYYFNSKFIEINEGSFINRNCNFYSGYQKEFGIKIGENCFIGMDVNLICISHEVGEKQKRAGVNKFGSIIIGDGTWIGGNVTILPGVTIGEGCIIGAGSVVLKDCEPNCLYAGNPARKIKELD